MGTNRLLQGEAPPTRLHIKTIIFSAVFLISIAIAGCNSQTPSQVANMAIGGTVSGLNGSVVLQNNGRDDLTVLANGSFGFVTPIQDGSPYNVTVRTQPIGQTCLVSSGTGTVQGSSDHSHVAVACSTNSYTVGGSITGLTNAVVLQDNNGDDLTLAANGVFTFATSIQNNYTYNVTVLTQPTGQTCSVSTGAGTVSGGNVANVVVVCSTNSYTVGGTISGLTGTVVLRDNSGDNLTIAANGVFTFATQVADNSPYSVTVFTQPIGQSCSVAGGTGTIAAANVTNAAITCAINTFTIGGTASGLNGTMVLQNNNSDNLNVAVNGPFTFATIVNNNSTYNVTVLTQPVSQTCSVSTGAGTVSGGNVANVAVVCSTNTYNVGGTVSGLTGTVVLRDNNTDDRTLAANGVFTFATKVADGSPYSVTVLTQPASQSCSVASGIGTIAAANVTNPAITCAINTFTIGGTVFGLTGNMHLQNNNSDDLNLFSNGTFTFATAVAYGNPYSVTLWSLSNADQTYTITNGSGAATANVTDVTINVSPCTIGFSNCDMDNSNGCEINTQTDMTNCGNCGTACKLTDSCVAGICIPPPCTMDADCPGPGATCSSGVCIAECSVASECPGSDTACRARTCSAGTCGYSYMAGGTSCDDASACTTGDVCNGSGTCLGGAAANCNDSNACTADACDAALGCTHAPLNGGACDDGNPCTVSDSCSAGACVGSNVANGSSCGGGSTCQSGVCSIPCTSQADCIFGSCQSGTCQP